MDTEEIEALNPLHYNPVDGNRDVVGPPFPVVYDQLLCLTDVEGEVVVLAPHCQVTDILPICRLVVGNHAYSNTVGSSANLMMVLKSCTATQSWVNKQGVQEGIKHAPLRISMEDVLLRNLTTWGQPIRKYRIQLQREVFTLCP